MAKTIDEQARELNKVSWSLHGTQSFEDAVRAALLAVARDERERDAVLLENIHHQPCICIKCQYYAEAAAAIRASTIGE